MSAVGNPGLSGYPLATVSWPTAIATVGFAFLLGKLIWPDPGSMHTPGMRMACPTCNAAPLKVGGSSVLGNS